MPVIQTITTASGTSAYVPTARQLTINGVTYDLTADRSWTIEVLDNLIATAPLSYNSGTNTISISQATNSTDGYLSSADWLTFSSKQNAITLTTTGNSGAASLVGATLNIPEYTLAGLGGFSNPMTSLGDIIYGNAVGIALRRAGNATTTKMFLSSTGDGTNANAPIWEAITPATISAVPTSRTITINGTTLDLSANRSWSVGTVTSIGLSSTTSGITIGSTPVTSSGTITIDIATATSTSNGLLSSSDWSYFDAKMGNPFTTLGDIVYSNAIGIPLRRAGNITTTKMFLSQTGDGTSSSAPIWSVVTAADTGAVPTSRQLTINGTAYDLTADRSWSVGTITSLTGEATGSGTGAVSVTLTNSAVIGKVLTGLSISGGTIASTDSILTAFGKLQNQVNGLVGGVMYQGTWNASTNTPALSSSTGTKGHYYVVSVAGSTNLDGITDWKLGDWAIFNGSTWEKVDNTDAVTSVNGYTGAVVLTTSDVAEGTRLYYTDARARLALSLTTTGSSGAATYNNTTGVFNIPNYTLSGLGGVPTTRTLTINGTAYDLSADRSWSVGTVTSVSSLTIGTTGTDITSSVANGTTTPVIILNIPTASSVNRGALSSTDWSTFNSKQNALNGTGFVKISGTTISYDNSTYYLASNPSAYITLTSLSAGAGISYNNTTGVITSTITQYTDALARLAISESVIGLDYNNTTGVFSLTSGYVIPTTTSATNWDAAYNDKINSAAVTGTTTKTLTLTQQDGGTITASWTDDNTDAVTSVFGRTGAVVAQSGDYNTSQVTESGNLYYLDSRARAALSFTAGSGAYNSTTGVITIPTNTNQLTNGAAFITLTSLSAGTGISYNNTTGVITSTITQYTDALARASISETITGIDYNNTTGVFSITAGYGIPTTTSQANWDTAYTNRITSLTTTGSSGAATIISNTLNIPNYTAAGLGAVPTTRTITINDVVFDLSANRSWSVGDFGTW